PVERPPAPESKSAEATPEATQPSMADIRNELAAKNLAEAQAFAKEHPGDPWTYAEKLQDLARTYGSTPAGAEAAKTLAGLKLPPKPERVGSGDWETLFAEGKDPFKLGQLEGWRMVNGLLERNPAIDNSAQVKKVVTDGEFRIRFEWSGDGQAYFAFRQGRGGNYRIHFDKPLATKTKGKVNELIVLLDGKRCTATLNGETCSVLSQGDPDSGMIQFNTKSEMMRIHSIEQRGLAVKP
ncbi:MAG: hypothetical protein KIS92_16380, partial [Planctomycetota bacterium]|nr:hypothetical protein [Planctomycetota bacterium]